MKETQEPVHQNPAWEREAFGSHACSGSERPVPVLKAQPGRGEAHGALQTCFHWEPDFEESFLLSALRRQAFSYCFRTYTTDQLGSEHFAESPVYQSAAVIDACLYRHIFFF